MVFFLLAGASSAASDADKHYYKGVEYASEGKFIQAREEFKEALNMDPRDLSFKNSLRHIGEAIDLKVKKEAVIHVFKGVALCNENVWDKGISEFTKAMEIDPKYASAYYDRGNAYKIKGQNDRAISDYTRAIEIDPKFAMSYYNRGVAYETKGQYDQSMSDYTRAIEIDPKFAMAYNNRGFVYQEEGQYDRSISEFTRAIEIDPKLALAYNNRGFVYMVKLNEKMKGCENWKKACELGSCGNYNIAKRKGLCR